MQTATMNTFGARWKRRTGRPAWGLGAVLAAAAAALLLVSCGSDQPRDDTMTTSVSASVSVDGVPAGVFAADAEDGAARGGFAPSRAPALASRAQPASPASAPSSQLDLLGRTIIRSGSVVMEVESVADAFEAVSAVAVANGGFVADSGFSGTAERATARLTLRFPAERFDDVLRELRALAVEVSSVRTSSQDVTEEFTDLAAQLHNLRAVEGQYIELLGRAHEIGDILIVQDRLNQTRMQIERVQGRTQLLASLSSLATLSVELYPPAMEPVVATGGGTGPIDAAGAAWTASLKTLSTIATVMVVGVVYSWWLVPLLVVMALLLRGPLRAWAAGRERTRTALPPVVDTPQATT